MVQLMATVFSCQRHLADQPDVSFTLYLPMYLIFTLYIILSYYIIYH